MLKKFMNKKLVKNEKGLTLVELLAVIVILAIVAAIAVPAIGNVIENSRYKAAKADAITVLNAANIYFTEKTVKDGDKVTIEALNTAGYLEDLGTFGNADGEKGEVTKLTGGNTLSATATYSGEVTVKFDNTTIQDITKDERSAKEARDGKNTITVPKVVTSTP
ncbi:hypothetical protein CH76_01060 [Lysinibacillus sp. BF-4]|uniref:prepilin-type N-terminal cleavage/methylation domain-containing protein n=1 Tax=Lysinibacillus sp. BF-4 TaxID=1473546 RepID=UPI000500A0EC|nr:prepilin-type N-terminal cleavage/methylation domain-containing protein [Lysinibacillus sp. BF-4]KFL44429.1 hypothetical protein CH76_01060 [Lysinibacillus sp. BF-4]